MGAAAAFIVMGLMVSHNGQGGSENGSQQTGGPHRKTEVSYEQVREMYEAIKDQPLTLEEVSAAGYKAGYEEICSPECSIWVDGIKVMESEEAKKLFMLETLKRTSKEEFNYVKLNSVLGGRLFLAGSFNGYEDP